MSELDEILEIPSDELDPEVVARRLNTSVCHATNLCLKLVEVGKLRLKFKVFCPKCGDVCAEFERIMDIPDELRCGCGYAFMPARENMKIVFKKP